ncbi:MAG: OmpA family protein [Rhodothermales bacterium]
MKTMLSFLFTLLLITQSYAQTNASPGEGVWANYDFVPGHKVLAYHDFESDLVGNFPNHVQYLNGDMEVVRLADDNQVLRTKNEGRFLVATNATLPEKYTVEFRISATDKRSKVMMYSPAEKAPIKSPGDILAGIIEPAGAGLSVGKYVTGPKATQKLAEGAFVKKWIDVRIAVDGAYWKMYINEKRVSNIPQVEVPRGDGLAFYYSVYPYDDGEVYIDDIRIAAGGRSMLYEELQANGMVITHGILFDTNKADLKPESTPTLMDIAGLLKKHKDVKLRIEGHTDNTGADEANLLLSKARADSVRDWLINTQGIDSARLTVEGHGASKPVDSNGTSAGRQANRRVELHQF